MSVFEPPWTAVEALDGHEFLKHYNEKIVSATFGEEALVLVLASETVLTIGDGTRSCCESRYMRSDDDCAMLVGKRLRGVVLKAAPDVVAEGGECHEVQFLEVQTDEGCFTACSHNEHNGYYGGIHVQIAVGVTP